MNKIDASLNVSERLIWRQQLLARLAAERAYLLLQFRSLDEETLTSIPAVGSLTFKNVLLHVAAWDAFHTEKISLVRNGRFAELVELTPESLNRRNAELEEQFQDISLERALAVCLKERAGFLAELKRVPDEALHKRMTLPSGHRVRMRTWARWRFLHDMDHAAQLEAWRQQQSQETVRQVGPKYILQAIFNAARKEVLSLIPLIPEEERVSRSVCGVWGLKDLLGHLTDWERVGLDGLCQLADGKVPEFDYEIPDFDAFNNKNAEARSGQSWADTWADLTQTRKDFTDLFDQLPEKSLARPMPTPWGGATPVYFWILVWAGHDHEHAIDVRQALQLQSWPRRLRAHPNT